MLRRLAHGALVGGLLCGVAGLLETAGVLLASPYHRDLALWWEAIPLYLGAGAALGAAVAFLLPLFAARRVRAHLPGLGIAAGVASVLLALALLPSLDDAAPLRGLWSFPVGGVALLALRRATAHDRAWVVASAFSPISCVAGIALLTAAGFAGWRLPVRPAPGAVSIGEDRAGGAPNLMFVVLGGVGADRVGSFGHYRPTTPELDALAAESVAFHQVFAPSPRAGDGLRALLLGVDPQHDATGVVALAEALGGAGWQCASVTGGATWREDSEMRRGFEQLWDAGARSPRSRLLLRRLLGMVRPPVRQGAAAVVTRGLRWIDGGRGRDSGRPFFLVLELDAARAPFTPPTDQAARFLPERIPAEAAAALDATAPEPTAALDAAAVAEVLAARHDAEILAQDAAIAQLVDGLAERDLLEETLLVIVSDGAACAPASAEGVPTAERLRVPLLLRHPKTLAAGTRVPHLVALRDVPATAAAFLGLGDTRIGAEARSLLPLLRDGAGRELLLLFDEQGRAAAVQGDRVQWRGGSPRGAVDQSRPADARQPRPWAALDAAERERFAPLRAAWLTEAAPQRRAARGGLQ